MVRVELYKNGCYTNCASCTLTQKCCSHFNEMNAPVLNREEQLEIQNYIGYKQFCKKIKDNIFHMSVDDSDCVFYKNGKCTIYQYRPVDCKLFPYDIIKKNKKYYLIIYFLECLNIEEFIKNNPCDKDLIEQVKPWIKDFTSKINYSKMGKWQYKIIEEIEIS